MERPVGIRHFCVTQPGRLDLDGRMRRFMGNALYPAADDAAPPPARLLDVLAPHGERALGHLLRGASLRKQPSCVSGCRGWFFAPGRTHQQTLANSLCRSSTPGRKLPCGGYRANITAVEDDRVRAAVNMDGFL